MVQLAKILDFLETYRGRDKVLRTLCYTSKCASGLIQNEGVSARLDSFSGQLSACRATLRLLDDIPMLAYFVEYGLGDKVCIFFFKCRLILPMIQGKYSGKIDLGYLPVGEPVLKISVCQSPTRA